MSNKLCSIYQDSELVLYSRAATSAYLRKSGVPFTLFYTSFYYSNLSLFDAFVRDPKTGGWRLDFPFPTDVPLPSVSPRDIGAFVSCRLYNLHFWASIFHNFSDIRSFCKPLRMGRGGDEGCQRVYFATTIWGNFGRGDWVSSSCPLVIGLIAW